MKLTGVWIISYIIKGILRKRKVLNLILLTFYGGVLMEKMKAAVMYGPNDIRIEQVPKPNCEDDGIILKVSAIGLCGSDIRNLTTDSRNGVYPHIYGHEHAGVITEVGGKVEKFKVGERVFVHPGIPCMKCDHCRSGNDHLCKNFTTYASKQGGFAQYMPIPAWGIKSDRIWKIPEGVKLEDVTLAEPLSSVFACQENIDVKLGETVVIIGAGPIGCFHAEIAKMRGANKVIMVEINDERLKLALNFGVDYIINSTKEDPIKAVMDITEGKGAHKIISANPSTKAQQQSIYMCAPGGIVVFFGGVPKGELTEIDSNHIHYSGIWVYGHYAATNLQCKKAYELVISGRLDASKYITHVMPLDEINKAIHITRSGEAIKVVLIP